MGNIESIEIIEPNREYPDIDVDISDNININMSGRDFLIEYLNKKYGEEYVACVGTQGEYSGKSVIRDLGQVYNLPSSDTVACSKEYNNDLSVYDNIEKNKNVKEYFEKYPHLIDKVDRIVGCIASLGIHAGGVVITDKNRDYQIDKYCALYKSAKKNDNDSKIATLYNKKELQEIGLIKYDLLGLTSAGQIHYTKKMLGVDSYYDFPEDEEVYRDVVLNNKHINIFQFETQIGSRAFEDLKPMNIMELSNASGIIRIIGSKEGAELYNKYKENVAQAQMGNTDYWVDDLREQIVNDKNFEICKKVLEPTYGILIYQEQLANLIKYLSGGEKTFSDGNTVRKLLDKFGEKWGPISGYQGNKKLLKEWHTEFMSIMDEYLLPYIGEDGYDTDDKNLYDFLNFNLTKDDILPTPNSGIIQMMISSAAYLFSVLHAISYSTNTYNMMYLKHYHPLEFWTASLKYESNNLKKVSSYISAIMSENYDFKILKPNINKSFNGFEIENGNIRFGLSSIFGVSNAADYIINERTVNGEYKSIEDFYTRIKQYKSKVSKRCIEPLMYVGAFEDFGDLKTVHKELSKYYKLDKLETGSVELAVKEMKYIGVSISYVHPIFEQAQYMLSLEDYEDVQEATLDVAVVVNQIKTLTTKKGKPYALFFVTELKTMKNFRIFDWDNNSGGIKENDFKVLHISKKGNFINLRMSKNYKGNKKWK